MPMKTMFMFLIIVVMATSLTEAQNPIGIVRVNGTRYCSSNGSHAGYGNAPPPFSGASVQVGCSENVVAYAQANVTTNSNGVYLVVLVPFRNTKVNSIVSSCRLSVLTPLSTCNPTLPSSGLVSNLKFVKTVVGFLPLPYFVASGFTLQT